MKSAPPKMPFSHSTQPLGPGDGLIGATRPSPCCPRQPGRAATSSSYRPEIMEPLPPAGRLSVVCRQPRAPMPHTQPARTGSPRTPARTLCRTVSPTRRCQPASLGNSPRRAQRRLALPVQRRAQDSESLVAASLIAPAAHDLGTESTPRIPSEPGADSCALWSSVPMRKS